jgi:toluene monooxygenase system ferredoxin subunit
MTFREVLGEAELWVGEMRQVALHDCRVLLLRTEQGVRAYEDRCPHLGVPLSTGTLEGNIITCAAHHFQYEASSGRGNNPKHLHLRVLGVRCRTGMILVDTAPPGDSG